MDVERERDRERKGDVERMKEGRREKASDGVDVAWLSCAVLFTVCLVCVEVSCVARLKCNYVLLSGDRTLARAAVATTNL